MRNGDQVAQQWVPAKYKYVVLLMIFLKYANERFGEYQEQMIKNGNIHF